jgi:hypothetical protein
MKDIDRIKILKIVIVIALILGAIGAIFYLIYGFTIIWQGIAAGVIIGFLCLLLIIFIGLSIFLWVKNLLIKREIKKYQNLLENANQKIRYLESEIKKKNKEGD